MRKILYLSGTRADYGLMQRSLKAIEKHPDLTLEVAATGMHMMADHGMTVEEIRKDGFVLHELPITYEGDTRTGMAKFVGECVKAFVEVCEKTQPDVILLLGDRGEMLAGAIAGAYMGIAVAHIHGGEVTSTIDESARHAITKLAHIHFPATEESAERIRRMGEQPSTVYVVGAPGLVGIDKELFGDTEIRERLNLNPKGPFAMLLQHPVSQEVALAEGHIGASLEALKEMEIPAVVIYPNADAGGRAMIGVIESYRDDPAFSIHAHINRREFLSLMKHAAVMIGNSSSGIIEAPSFHLPVVNLGTRQEGRQRGENVIDNDYGKDSVKEGMKKALYDRLFLDNLHSSVNPYGDGKTDVRIAKLLTEIEVSDGLLQKKLAY
ncbi:UDP-N-acetylglucosamine 2-epimerase [bacterium]|nr:UDP-N-acetylglucosamine 2-epimerase [bacterium]